MNNMSIARQHYKQKFLSKRGSWLTSLTWATLAIINKLYGYKYKISWQCSKSIKRFSKFSPDILLLNIETLLKLDILIVISHIKNYSSRENFMQLFIYTCKYKPISNFEPLLWPKIYQQSKQLRIKMSRCLHIISYLIYYQYVTIWVFENNQNFPSKN